MEMEVFVEEVLKAKALESIRRRRRRRVAVIRSTLSPILR